MSENETQEILDRLDGLQVTAGIALPGDRVRLFRTRGFDGKLNTRVWLVPGIERDALEDDLLALAGEIARLRHENAGDGR